MQQGVWRSAAVLRIGAFVVAAGILAGCGSTPSPEPRYKIGRPYQVNGQWYYPRAVERYEVVGVASWYGDPFHGRLTANGELFDKNRISAAHPTLPLPSTVRVTNLENGRTLILRVNDRGPFVKDRVIDLSRAAARRLGYERAGLARVHVAYLGPASLRDAIVRLDHPNPSRVLVAGGF